VGRKASSERGAAEVPERSPKDERIGRVRLRVEDLEAQLSPLAARSSGSRGRERPEEECGVRGPFQRDRDRIVHSKAFRRLKHKTQVFISPDGDHYRTRLTHVLEVSGIARTVARALRLNEDLTEAIALGHDLGHTPFGHAGEEALDEVVRAYGVPGFRHNEQSLRVVESVESEGRGLNLTWEVRDGILHHTGGQATATLEGRIVKLADRVAYINHDIDDALRAGLIAPSDLPPGSLAELGPTSTERIDALVHDLVDTSTDRGDIAQSPAIGAAMAELRAFLFETVYVRSISAQEVLLIRRVLSTLFDHYMAYAEELPALAGIAGTAGAEGYVAPGATAPAQAVVDYVAGMTDRYALGKYEDLTGRGLRIGQLRLQNS